MEHSVTSVTQTLRRVGEFDSEIVIEAIRRNQPSHIVMNHLDYINPNDREYFLENIESRIGQSIAWVGLSDCDLISRQAFGAEKSA